MSDRPWHRALIKIGMRLFLGSARAHFQDGFPGLKVVPATKAVPGSVHYRGNQVATLVSADALRDRSGDVVAIVGSGPSIADNDLSGLPAQSAILLNGAISLWGGAIKAPLAVAVEDERFIWRHFDLLKQHVGDQTPCLFSVEVLRAICEIDPGFLSARTIVLIDDIRKPYGIRRRRFDLIDTFAFVRRDAASNAGLSFAPDHGVFRGGSVAVSALQFA